VGLLYRRLAPPPKDHSTLPSDCNNATPTPAEVLAFDKAKFMPQTGQTHWKSHPRTVTGHGQCVRAMDNGLASLPATGAFMRSRHL
jgi:hypothetical protein